MKQFIISLLVIAFHVGLSHVAFGQAQGTLCIKAYNIRNNTGVLRFAIYNKKENFTNPTKVYKEGVVSIKNKLAQIISNLPAGKYAIALLHDENNSGGMDYFLKTPQEGYGFSNIKQFLLSKPSYEECIITINPNQITTIDIPMQYLY